MENTGSSNVESSGLIIIDYAEILADPDAHDGSKLQNVLAKAFGGRTKSAPQNVSSLGIIAIRNVPGFPAAKAALLPLAYKLAHLPKDYLETHLTDATSLYNAGWSHGKEKLGSKPDLAKGSYYFNPLTDSPGTADDRAKYPASYPLNVWPDESILPGFEAAAKTLGRLMHSVVVQLSKHIDAYAATQCSNYTPGLLHDAMRNTEKAKGRLLYYFPLPDGGNDASGNEEGDDSWIGWHNDSGFLTALAGDLYLDESTGRVMDESPIRQQAFTSPPGVEKRCRFPSQTIVWRCKWGNASRL